MLAPRFRRPPSSPACVAACCAPLRSAADHHGPLFAAAEIAVSRLEHRPPSFVTEGGMFGYLLGPGT